MTDPITPDELAAMKARCEAATAGPWFRWTNLDVSSESEDCIILRTELTTVTNGIPQATDHGNADLDFVANARTDMPRLIAEVERLRAELAAAQRHYYELQHEIRQTLGKALGYCHIHVKDGVGVVSPDTPGAVKTDDICVGDHVAETLAEEAATKLATAREAVECVAMIEGLPAGVMILNAGGAWFVGEFDAPTLHAALTAATKGEQQ